MTTLKNKTIHKKTEITKIKSSRLRVLIGFNIKMAFAQLQSGINSILISYNLRRTSYATLVLIMDNPSILQSQIAKFLGIDRPNMVILINHLKKLDLVRSERQLYDQRRFALFATQEGIEIGNQASQKLQELENKFLEEFSQEEKDKLKNYLNKIEKYEYRQ